MDFTKEEYQRRLKKVQKMMQEKGIELLISHDTNNLNYLTGYDAWSFYYAQCAIVHVLLHIEHNKKTKHHILSNNLSYWYRVKLIIRCLFLASFFELFLTFADILLL